MRRVNPLYVLYGLVALLILAFWMAHREAAALSGAVRDSHETALEVERIKGLKERWENPKEAERTLNRLLGHNAIAKSLTIRERTKEGMRFGGTSLDAKSAGYLLQKVFAEPFAIRTFEIERHRDGTVDVSVEVAF